MLHTLTRAFLIPLLAFACLVVLWLVMGSTPTQAHFLPSFTTLSVVAGEATNADKTANSIADQATETTVAPQMTSLTDTIKIYPLPRHKLRGLFDAQAMIVTGQGASIFFTKTVGTDIEDCFASKIHELVVAPTTTVTYCYIAVNTGSLTLTHHTIVDEKLGTLATDLPFTLTPFGTDNDAAFFPFMSLITQTSASNATWTAKQDAFVASASDATLVIVPTIDIDSTVVANSARCSGGQKSLRVALNTPLLYCYALKNTSPITLPIQTVIDSNLGTLVNNLRYPLPAGATFTITHTVAAIHSATSVVTWTSATDEGVAVTASDIVTVQVPASIDLLARASTAGDACSGATSLTVAFGSPVVFCYLIRNNGGAALQQHQITDGVNGTEAFTRTVEVDRLLGVTVTKVITQNMVNTVTWLAKGTNGDVTIDEAVITVSVTPTTAAQVFIYQDSNQNNQSDAGEFGIAQVIITLTSPSGQIFSAKTNAVGIAIFAPLPEAGSYTIAIDQTSLPLNYVRGETLEEITIRSGELVTMSIGYQEADIAKKVYLPTIAK